MADRRPTLNRANYTSIRPAIQKRPNVIAVEPRKTADRPVICPVNVVPTPQEVHKSRCIGTHAGELFPEEPEVVSAEIAKEASTEGPPDKEDFPKDRNYLPVDRMSRLCNINMGYVCLRSCRRFSLIILNVIQ